MSLQELIGELQTLALAYPGETPMTVRLADNKTPLDMVMIEADQNSVEIVVKG
jgi:hypothetical protein